MKCFVGLDDNKNELDCAPLFDTPLCVNATSAHGVTFTCNHKSSIQRFTSGIKDSGCKDILTGKNEVKYRYCVCNSDLCNSASSHKGVVNLNWSSSKSSTINIGILHFNTIIVVSVIVAYFSKLMSIWSMESAWSGLKIIIR